MTETTDQMMKRLNALPPATSTSTADRTVPVYVAPGYDSLFNVLTRALHQAQDGNGKERHAQPGQAFEDQPIISIGQLVGMGFQNGQAIKKMVEAQGMVARGDFAAAEREILGAINYLAATVIEVNRRATVDL
jgi:hypothetical protein